MSETNVTVPFESPEKRNGKEPGLGSCATASRMDMENGVTPEKPDPLKEFRESLKALQGAVAEFGEARIDGIRVSAWNFMLKAALGGIGAVAAVVFIVVSVVLLLMGLAGGVARLLDAPLWTGHLIVGVVCVGIPAGVLWIKAHRIKAQWLAKLRDKYAGRTEMHHKQ